MARWSMRSRVAALVAAGVVVVVGPTTTAIAMPSWTAPVTITDPDEIGEFGAVAMDGRGNTMAVWYQQQPPSPTDFLLRVAYRPAGGSFSPPQTVGEANQPSGGNIPPSPPQIAFDAAGNATAVWLQADGAGDLRVVSAVAAPGGSFAPIVTLSPPGRSALFPSLAVNGRGDGLAAWTYEAPDDRIDAVVRAPGGVFGAFTTISDPGAGVPVVALDAAGSGAAAWQLPDGTVERVQLARRPAGGSFGPPVFVSPPGVDADIPRLAADAGGNLTAVWAQGSEAINHIVAAFASPDGPLGTPEQISTEAALAEGPQLALDRFGNATAIWFESVDSVTTVVAGYRPVSRSFGPGQLLASSTFPTSFLGTPQLAVGALADAFALWSFATDAGFTSVQARVRPRTAGTFGAEQTLSGPELSSAPDSVASDDNGNAAGLLKLFASPGDDRGMQIVGYDGAGPQLRGLAFPGPVQAGRPLRFAVAPVDVWSAVDSVVWDFGDGGSASGSSVTHAYAEPGLYRAQVTATDTLGNESTATAAVRATPAPPPPPVPPPRRAARAQAIPVSAFVRVTRKGVARVRVRCRARGVARCHGRLTLIRGDRGLGARRFAIPAGARRTVRVRLRRAARTRLAELKVMTVKARTHTRQPSGGSRTIERPLVLRAPRPAHGHVRGWSRRGSGSRASQLERGG
jgi:hypothetical protein